MSYTCASQVQIRHLFSVLEFDRGIWLRLLHQKISCRFTLHHTIPTILPRPSVPSVIKKPSRSHILFTRVLRNSSFGITVGTNISIRLSIFLQLDQALFGLYLDSPLFLFHALDKPSPFQVLA
ncbi:hypothetical protein CU098_010232 [Rhizopus stolonifer]|uniref:Uncharacterized protein n=1 Tax=Rhizopus stolonifer TaxID=4846 RepID=A0A367KNA9_RHIST|nr:hypothetical protein CU098_010232 [Rhizopus stolonifer]